MTLFNERERAYEQMFVHDEEARFRALARRNKLLGEWAASRLGLTGEPAAAYVAEISRGVVTAGADDRLAERLRSDFEAAGVPGSGEEIERRMAEFLAEAIVEVRSREW